MTKLWKVRFSWMAKYTEEYITEYRSINRGRDAFWSFAPAKGERVIIMAGKTLDDIAGRALAAAQRAVELGEAFQTPEVEIQHIELFVNGDGVAYDFAR